MKFDSLKPGVILAIFCACMLLLTSRSALSDGVNADAGDRGASGVASATAAQSLPAKPACQPYLNHESIVLRDGRLLVAGGQATINVAPDREIHEDSELWDPATGQWQALDKELQFESSQAVHLNQLGDGRVLFLAIQDQNEQGKAEYQLRVWDPAKNSVERLPIGIKPKRNSDGFVLSDGRVLVVNGNEASADVWDMRTGTQVHTEVPELENLRWRGLLLRDQQMLLVAALPVGSSAARKRIDYSAVLLWDTRSGEWKQLGNLPVPLRAGSTLKQLDNGAIYAGIGDDAYQLAALDKQWETATPIAQTGRCSSANASPDIKPAEKTPEIAAQPPQRTRPAEEKPDWWSVYVSLFTEMYGVPLVIAVPVVLYLLLRRLKGERKAQVQKSVNRTVGTFVIVVGVCLSILLILVVTYFSGRGQLRLNAAECMNNLPAVNGKRTALASAKQAVACLEEKNGIFSTLAFRKDKERLLALPSVPCRYVGVWSSTRLGPRYKITLTDDSQFIAELVSANNTRDGAITGSWGVVGNEMIWLYDSLIYSPSQPLVVDANRISPESRSRFTLDEEDGSQTVFELQDAITSNNCTP